MQNRTRPVLRWGRRVTLGLAAVSGVLALTVSGWTGNWFNLRSSLQFATASAFSSLPTVELPIVGPIQVSTLPEVTLESGSLVVPGKDAQNLRNAIPFGGSSKTRISVDEVVLKTPRIIIRIPSTALPARSGLRLPEVIGPLSAALRNFNFKRLKIVNGSLELHQPIGKSQVITNLNGELQVHGGFTAKVVGSFDYKKQRQTFAFTLGNGVKVDNKIEFPLRTRIEGKNGTAAFAGTVDFAGGINAVGLLQMSMPDVGETLAWLGHADLTIPEKTKFRANGPVTWASNILSFQEARFTFGKNSSIGSLAFSFAKSVPSLEGTLDFKNLDITELLPRTPDGKPVSPVVAIRDNFLKPVQSESRSPKNTASANAGSYGIRLYAFPILHRFNTDLRISADDIVAGDFECQRSALTLALRSGKLFADIAEMQLGEGTVRGQLEVEVPLFRKPVFSIRGSFENVDTAPLLKGLGAAAPPLSGRTDMTIDLSASGASRDELVSSLDGKVDVHMLSGGRAQLDMPQIITDLDKSGRKPWDDKLLNDSSFDELVARLSITRGVAKSKDLMLRVGRTLMTGGGKVHLKNRKLKLEMRMGRSQSDGKLGPNSKLMTVSGSIDAPAFAIR